MSEWCEHALYARLFILVSNTSHWAIQIEEQIFITCYEVISKAKRSVSYHELTTLCACT